MKAVIFTYSFLIIVNVQTAGQDLPGMNYCLLFDSPIEKQAFQNDQNKSYNPLIFLLADDPQIDSAKYMGIQNELMEYGTRLKEKKAKRNDDRIFLEYLFYHVHRKYLKNYKHTSNFSGIMDNGQYNCVSASALYACFLEHLCYPYQIYETQYHIFLTIHTTDGIILFESTDPVTGFLSKESEIHNQIAEYLENDRIKSVESFPIATVSDQKRMLNEITLTELAGLNYYNKGVECFNKLNYTEAYRALKKALILYPDSRRINDFLILTVEMSDLQLLEAFRLSGN